MSRVNLPPHDHDVATCRRCAHRDDWLSWFKIQYQTVYRSWQQSEQARLDARRDWNRYKAMMLRALGLIRDTDITLEEAKALAEEALPRRSPGAVGSQAPSPATESEKEIGERA